jgi:hypothetical protein
VSLLSSYLGVVFKQQHRLCNKKVESTKLPELCRIEKYWAIVKWTMYKSGSAVTNDASMTRKWKQHSEKVNKATVQTLMGGIKRKTRKFHQSANV